MANRDQHVQALPPQQNWNQVMEQSIVGNDLGDEDANVDRKPPLANLVYAVHPESPRLPCVDIKVEVEEQGVFDMELQAIGNVVRVVDEEDVAVKDSLGTDPEKIVKFVDISQPVNIKKMESVKSAEN